MRATMRRLHLWPARTRAGAHLQAPQQLPEPSPEGIAQLAAMGFDQARAARALQETGNDVNSAIALLV